MNTILPTPFGDIKCIVSDHWPKDRIGLISEAELQRMMKDLETSFLNGSPMSEAAQRLHDERQPAYDPSWLKAGTTIKPAPLNFETLIRSLDHPEPILLHGIACNAASLKQLRDSPDLLPDDITIPALHLGAPIIIDSRMITGHFQPYWNRASFESRLKEQNEFDAKAFGNPPLTSGEDAKPEAVL